MSLVNLSVAHGTNLDDAKTRLASAVTETKSKFAGTIRSEEWNLDRSGVRLTGPGVVLDLRVDAEHVHATGDIPLLSNLLGSNFGQRISEGVRTVIGKHFKKLPDQR